MIVGQFYVESFIIIFYVMKFCVSWKHFSPGAEILGYGQLSMVEFSACGVFHAEKLCVEEGCS